MNMLIVTFNLSGITDAQYRAACEGEAAAFANIPGCVGKVWIADESTNTYGGVYTFVDKAAVEAYRRSELFRGMQADTTLVNLSSKDCEVLDGPTQITTRRSAPASVMA